MASPMDILFGTAPRLETEEMGLLSPEQEELMQSLMGFFGEQGFGERFGGLEQLSLAGLEGLLGENGLFSQFAGGIGDVISGAGPAFEEQFQKGVAEPLTQQFTEDILPGIDRSFASSGFFGTDRAGVQGKALEQLTESLVRGKSEAQIGARQQALEALGLIPQGAGAQARVSEVGLDQRRRDLAQILASLGISTKENIAVGLPGQKGIAGDIAKAIGTAVASSEVLKHDIVPVDETTVLNKLAGLPIMEWSYHGSNVRHIGPMAETMQETFGVGDGNTIHLVDVMGILLLAAKAVAKKIGG